MFPNFWPKKGHYLVYFNRPVNPVTTRGADYTHHITASPPGFENPAASLRLGDSDVRILLGIQGRLHKTFLVHFLILKTREINSECNFDLSNWVTQLWIFALLSFCFYCWGNFELQLEFHFKRHIYNIHTAWWFHKLLI